MKLSEWIDREGGRVAVARKLGVTPQAVCYWLTRGMLPRVSTVLKIVRLSEGRVTFEEILGEAVDLSVKFRRKNRGRK